MKHPHRNRKGVPCSGWLMGLITVACFWLPSLAQAAPYCVVDFAGKRCGFSDMQSCRQAAGEKGSCVLDQERMRAPSGGSPWCLVESWRTECIDATHASCMKRAASRKATCIRNPNIVQHRTPTMKRSTGAEWGDGVSSSGTVDANGSEGRGALTTTPAAETSRGSAPRGWRWNAPPPEWKDRPTKSASPESGQTAPPTTGYAPYPGSGYYGPYGPYTGAYPGTGFAPYPGHGYGGAPYVYGR
ncbi:MAG: hypothetical protein HQL50_05130 [Magnetococcales bacterium]|nr:hypothetical protein [Magnetococcales bacterium]